MLPHSFCLFTYSIWLHDYIYIYYQFYTTVIINTFISMFAENAISTWNWYLFLFLAWSLLLSHFLARRGFLKQSPVWNIAVPSGNFRVIFDNREIVQPTPGKFTSSASFCKILRQRRLNNAQWRTSDQVQQFLYAIKER